MKTRLRQAAYCLSGQMRQHIEMPATETPIVRSIFLLHFWCGICSRRWCSDRPFSAEHAFHVQEVLKDANRGFKVVLCEPCWDAGNHDQSVGFYFTEHPVH